MTTSIVNELLNAHLILHIQGNFTVFFLTCEQTKLSHIYYFAQKYICLWNLHIQENRFILGPLLATQPVYTKLTQKNRLVGVVKNYTKSCCWNHVLWRHLRRWIIGSEHSFESKTGRREQGYKVKFTLLWPKIGNCFSASCDLSAETKGYSFPLTERILLNTDMS